MNVNLASKITGQFAPVLGGHFTRYIQTMQKAGSGSKSIWSKCPSDHSILILPYNN